jgi:peroxiredoxin
MEAEHHAHCTALHCTALLGLGEPAPWFTCRTETRERFVFDTVAGRYLQLSFLDSAADPISAQVVALLAASRARFDDYNLSLFGVTVDPEDERLRGGVTELPGIRYVWDFDRQISGLYGALQVDGSYRKVTYLRDPMLRVMAVLPFAATAQAHVTAVLALLDRLPAIGPAYPARSQAPVLVLLRVFEPSLCQALMDYYRT